MEMFTNLEELSSKRASKSSFSPGEKVLDDKPSKPPENSSVPEPGSNPVEYQLLGKTYPTPRSYR